jgi:hypothetical protein
MKRFLQLALILAAIHHCEEVIVGLPTHGQTLFL